MPDNQSQPSSPPIPSTVDTQVVDAVLGQNTTQDLPTQPQLPPPATPELASTTPNSANTAKPYITGMTLTIGTIECMAWDDINIDSDIGIPADGWSFAWLGMDIASLPSEVKSGAVCTISYIQGDKSEDILVGVVDKIQQTISHGQSVVQISGRDLAGQLLDTSVPITQEQNMTLEEIVGKFVLAGDLSSLPWNVLVTQENWLKAKTGVQDGESVWDAINKAATASGQYVWVSAQGAICIGNPFGVEQPAKPPIFVLNKQHKNNNVKSISYSEDLSNAYSTVEVVGQDDKGKNFRGTATDNRLTIKRRKILNVAQAENQAEAQQYAQKTLRDGWLEAYECTVSVPFWGQNGELYQTGWKVVVDTDVMPRAKGYWVIYGRTFKLNRQEGRTCELRLRKYEEWMQPVQHVELVKDKKTKQKPKQKTLKTRRKH